MRPIRAKEHVKRVEGPAKTKSAISAKPKPAPAACPFTAAITGSSRWRSSKSRVCDRRMRALPATTSLRFGSFMAFTSPPAQNELPAPVITNAFTSVPALALRS